jgi:hypothetical protein
MDDKLQVGDVVQINPEIHTGFFAGCLMIVTNVKKSFIEGYIPVPHREGELPVLAEYRAKPKEIIRVGRAEWMLTED